MSDRHADAEPALPALDDDEGEDIASKTSQMSYWQWFMEILGASVRVSVIAGVFFTGFQYWALLNREKTERSLELVDLWESERVHGAEIFLYSRLQQLQERAMRELDPAVVSRDMTFLPKFVAEKFIEETRTNHEARESFRVILYFLNRVSHCATSKLCDVKVLDDFFKDYTAQYWGYFGEALRSNGGAVPHPIEKYLLRDTK